MTTKLSKRIVSVVLAMSIVLSFALVSVSATDVVPDIAKTDYTPADVSVGSDGNLIKISDQTGNLNINSSKISATASGGIATVKANSDIAESKDRGVPYGFTLDKLFNSAWSDATTKPDFAQGSKVLFYAKVRNASDSTAEEGKINIAYDRAGNATTIWSDTYSSEADAFVVRGTDWVDFKTVTTVAQNWGTSRTPVIGLPVNTTNGTSVQLDITSMYYGEETAHDIEVTAEGSTLFAGASTTVTATIVNQLDDAYSGAQGGFTWYALSNDREAFVSGIAVTDNGDGTATVVIANTVKSGTYDIVAVSDTYEGFVKGTKIYVKSAADSTPADDGNLITKWYTDENPTGNSASVQNGTSGTVTTMTANSDLGSFNWGLQGFLVGTDFMEAKPEVSVGDKLLFGAKVKNASDSAVESGKISIVYQRTQSTYIWPDGYTGDTDGFVITGSDWVDFKTITTVPSTPVWDSYRGIVVGLPSGTVQGTKVSIDLSTMFYGFEAPYDIKVTAAETSVAAGDSLEINADIVNQLDTAYSEGDGEFTWYAMDADRKETIDGIEIVAGDNGAATVTVDASVAVGTYDIVAVSDDYEGFVKGIEIEVTEASAEPEIVGITLTKTAGGVTVATDTALTDAQLIFVTYESGKMVSVNIDTKVNLDAQKSQEYPIPTGFTGARVMLWTKDFAPLAKALD